jgi:hypothetical protein
MLRWTELMQRLPESASIGVPCNESKETTSEP